MKAWSDDHPKAKLMARKRLAIAEAARETFLRVGYEGASMESIAAAAGVSIMTLYRHAESKEDLFTAVILDACDHSGHDGKAGHDDMMHLPLLDVLVKVGELFQQKLTQPDTISLLRTVMIETGRFPQLADAAYQGFVHAWQVTLSDFLSKRSEFVAVTKSARSELVADFLNDLMGTDILRVLLGSGEPDKKLAKRRAASAARKLLAALPQ